jgi:hypothetical protein
MQFNPCSPGFKENIKRLHILMFPQQHTVFITKKPAVLQIVNMTVSFNWTCETSPFRTEENSVPQLYRVFQEE